ncbi:MAG: hypothetical protein G3W58_19195 [Pantoea ananatis]|jgi:hypothetical protein|uniref:hypothetical protein n=1 Tax=Pantoea TaxID=53335 RepID=UPI0005B2CF6D|nr:MULTISPECIES: hypothetical protein [Pantoea]MCS4496688.1 hypothetical protein [Pantoea sp. B623]NEK83326.1 hypothetical protein [Pantoea ananatis]PQK79968.1 hypothetical protein CG428_00955 [Pantoea ananatis]REF10052.1 hypothetical protein C7428_2351 [Pantoea ananatis]
MNEQMMLSVLKPFFEALNISITTITPALNYELETDGFFFYLTLSNNGDAMLASRLKNKKKYLREDVLIYFLQKNTFENTHPVITYSLNVEMDVILWTKFSLMKLSDDELSLLANRFTSAIFDTASRLD